MVFFQICVHNHNPFPYICALLTLYTITIVANEGGCSYMYCSLAVYEQNLKSSSHAHNIIMYTHCMHFIDQNEELIQLQVYVA